MTLDEAREHIGAGVVYTPPSYNEPPFLYGSHRAKPIPEPPPSRKEDGIITSVSRQYVFVRYTGDNAAKATAPEMLELLTP